MRHRLRVGSLFSGIGGLDLGLEQAGMQVVWQCEINQLCREALQTHWSGVPCYRDITTLLRHHLTGIDLLAGGFPCQDLSVARHGSHLGLEGPNSGLVYEMGRIADALQPAWLVLENVPQVRNYLGPLREIFNKWELHDVTFRGYEAGATTRRQRTFIIGHTGAGSTEAVRLIRQSCDQVIQRGGTQDVYPLCLPWKGGPSLERLASCTVEDTKANPTRIRESDGVSRRVADGHLYLMLGNAVPPPMARLVGRSIMGVEDASNSS